MTQNAHNAFTLIELMLVMAIMGLMGTLSVGGYRAMRRGMEERGVMQNVQQFIRNAYQRAMIDRQPTAVYFWNETRRDESDDGTESILVVGRAVAVRRDGRITRLDGGNVLVDEFGDLRSNAGTDSEGEEYDDKEAKNGLKMFMYRINGDESGFQRSVVGQATLVADVNLGPNAMLTDPDWTDNNEDAKIEAFGYYVEDKGGITWKPGDAYGFEFADLTLPNNYIFESTFKSKVSDPIQTVNKVLRFSPTTGAGGQTVSVYSIRPGSDGSPKAQSIGSTP